MREIIYFTNAFFLWFAWTGFEYRDRSDLNGEGAFWFCLVFLVGFNIWMHIMERKKVK